MNNNFIKIVIIFVTIGILIFGMTTCTRPSSGTDNNDNGTKLSGAKSITAFNIVSPNAAGTINEANHTIAVTVPYGTNVTNLVASFTITGAGVKIGSTVQISGTTANDFTNTQTYTVTAEDGSSQNYSVTVSIALNTSKAITVFNIVSPSAVGTINESNHTITITVPYGTNVTNLVASFTTTGASVKIGSTVQISGTTANNFTNTQTYTVTAADGSTQNYSVTVSIALNTAKAMTSFGFSSLGITGTINETNHTIAVTVPYGTNVTNLVASFTITGAGVKIGSTVQISGTTANNFTNTQTYTVTAADGSTQNYSVTVSIALNTAKAITVFNIVSPGAVGIINESNHTIAVTVPHSTNITNLVAGFTTTGASVKIGSTVQISGTTANNFTNTQTYTVTAEDGSTQSYSVTVTASFLYVLNNNSNTVTFYNAVTGTYINGTLDNSSFITGASPYSVAVNPGSNILYVLNNASKTVTFYNATTGAYINGTLGNSSFTTGTNPEAIAVNPSANILYVLGYYGSHIVTYFNATTGAYINGTLENSSFNTGLSPKGVTVNPSTNILYVSNFGSNTVTYFNATTGAYMNGTLDNSSFNTGLSPKGVAVNPTANILYVANNVSTTTYTVTYFNATTGAYINGTLGNSSFTTGISPEGITVNPSANILYVSNFGSNSVTYFNATTGAYINGNFDNSSFTTGSGPFGITVNPNTNTLYVLNCYNTNTVTFYNATTGAYINGTLSNSSFTTGSGPYGVAVNP
jgi:DNA-binding beta-propeller fold protein YncE